LTRGSSKGTSDVAGDSLDPSGMSMDMSRWLLEVLQLSVPATGFWQL
jgi:hypothetical protein